MSFTFLTGGVLLVLVGKKALVKEFIAGIESFIGFLALLWVGGDPRFSLRRVNPVPSRFRELAKAQTVFISEVVPNKRPCGNEATIPSPELPRQNKKPEPKLPNL